MESRCRISSAASLAYVIWIARTLRITRFTIQAMIDMRNSSSEYKTDLRECTFNKAVEIEAGGKKNVIIYVPVPQLRMYRAVQEKLTRELEKKLGNKYVMFVAWVR